MEKKDLEEYLGIVVDLEKNIYIQEQLMEHLKQRIYSLGTPRQLVEPALPVKPTKPSLLFYIVIDALITAIATFIICIPIAIVADILDFEDSMNLIMGVIAVCIFLFFLFIFVSNGFNESGKYTKAMKNYQYEFEKYQNMLHEDQERLFAENEQKRMLQLNLQQIEEQNTSTRRTLADVYSLDIIYGKYRTFPQVCSLYEYIRSGRCTTLKEEKGFGFGGAYNLLEQEALQKTIILHLNQILQQLSAIQANQYMLYNAIEEGNQKLESIMTSINQISDNINQAVSHQDDSCRIDELIQSSEITAYHTERIEKELAYMNRMNYFAGKYDGASMFRQRPPV